MPNLWRINIIWHNHTGANITLKGSKLIILKICSIFFSTIIHVDNKLKNWGEKKMLAKKNEYIPNFSDFINFNKKTTLKGIAGKRIVKLAGLRDEKDHLNLLKAIKKVFEENSNWTLHLIGKDYNDTYSMELYQFINENKLEKQVFIYGVCEDIKNILSQVDIGVLSSKSEGLPISLLEYGLSCLPVVVTNVGECKNIVENNFSGYVVEKNNSDELFNALNKLINNKELRSLFGENLNKKILKKHSKSNFIKRLEKIYNNF